MSRVTCHMSRVTCHMSRAIYLFFFIYLFIFFFVRTKWWSLSVEGLSSTRLPRLVFSQFEFSSFVTPQHLDNRPLSGQLFPILAMFIIHVWRIAGRQCPLLYTSHNLPETMLTFVCRLQAQTLPTVTAPAGKIQPLHQNCHNF